MRPGSPILNQMTLTLPCLAGPCDPGNPSLAPLSR